MTTKRTRTWPSLGSFAAFRRFIAEARGATTVEYALMASLIGGMAILGSDALSWGMTATFGRVSCNIGQASAEGNVTLNVRQPLGMGLEPDPVIASGTSGQLMQMVCLGLVLPVGGAVWHSLYRRRRRFQGDLGDRDLAGDQRVGLRDALFAKRQAILHLFTEDLPSVVQTHLPARHLMTERPAIVSPNATPDEMRRLMAGKQIRHLLVCRESGQLVGIISDRDLKSRHGARAEEIMTERPITIGPDTSVSPAVTLMINEAISCLPVVQDGQVCGVLTSTDIMLGLQCSVQLLERFAPALRPEIAAGLKARSVGSGTEAQPA